MQPKVRHALSPAANDLPEEVDEAMWGLFAAINDLWEFVDDPPDPYRLRFRTFMDNRITLDPLYAGYYLAATSLIASIAEQKDVQAAYHLIYFGQDQGLAYPKPVLDAVQTHVSNEFIAMRLAYGGFLQFGALNFQSYFGGANIPGEPPPYRKAEGLP
jgi:hypothetical protein